MYLSGISFVMRTISQIAKSENSRGPPMSRYACRFTLSFLISYRQPSTTIEKHISMIESDAKIDAERRKAPTSRGFSSLTAGGASRSRTGLNGFAGRCITALLSRRKRTAEPSQQVARTTGSQICSMAGRSTKQKGKRCFPECMERETRLELATSTLARLRSTN